MRIFKPNEVLQTATGSIKIAVAWFTDYELFGVLLQKAQKGVQIDLLIANSFINHQSSIDYTQLRLYGGNVAFVGDDAQQAPLMHNKFCVIDDNILVFGSYNWAK